MGEGLARNRPRLRGVSLGGSLPVYGCGTIPRSKLKLVSDGSGGLAEGSSQGGTAGSSSEVRERLTGQAHRADSDFLRVMCHGEGEMEWARGKERIQETFVAVGGRVVALILSGRTCCKMVVSSKSAHDSAISTHRRALFLALQGGRESTRCGPFYLLQLATPWLTIPIRQLEPLPLECISRSLTGLQEGVRARGLAVRKDASAKGRGVSPC